MNTRHNLTLNFDERSTGFTWFFSFLVWFFNVKRTHGENLFVLLDDPGIGLHARAQADMLRYLADELEPYYQVLYTTHSPFMIDATELSRCRTVEDSAVRQDNGGFKFVGTKVGDRTFSLNPDTLAPLRAALGFEIISSMGGEKTLLVREPVEAMFLNWFSRRLKERRRVGLDEKWSIVPCGGGERIGEFLGLFCGDTPDVAVLLDKATTSRLLGSLAHGELLRGCRILTLDNYTEGYDGGIEDVMGPETYFSLVNMCYRLTRRSRLNYRKYRHAIAAVSLAGSGVESDADDDSQEEASRDDNGPSFQDVVDCAEKHFDVLRPTNMSYERTDLGEFLMENTMTCMHKLAGFAQALDRFEKLFQDINAL